METNLKETGVSLRNIMERIDNPVITEQELSDLIGTFDFLEGFFAKDYIILAGILSLRQRFDIMKAFRGPDKQVKCVSPVGNIPV